MCIINVSNHLRNWGKSFEPKRDMARWRRKKPLKHVPSKHVFMMYKWKEGDKWLHFSLAFRLFRFQKSFSLAKWLQVRDMDHIWKFHFPNITNDIDGHLNYVVSSLSKYSNRIMHHSIVFGMFSNFDQGMYPERGTGDETREGHVAFKVSRLEMSEIWYHFNAYESFSKCNWNVWQSICSCIKFGRVFPNRSSPSSWLWRISGFSRREHRSSKQALLQSQPSGLRVISNSLGSIKSRDIRSEDRSKIISLTFNASNYSRYSWNEKIRSFARRVWKLRNVPSTISYQWVDSTIVHLSKIHSIETCRPTSSKKQPPHLYSKYGQTVFQSRKKRGNYEQV